MAVDNFGWDMTSMVSPKYGPNLQNAINNTSRPWLGGASVNQLMSGVSPDMNSQQLSGIVSGNLQQQLAKMLRQG